MKVLLTKILYNAVSTAIGILLAIIIINSQNVQKTNNAEPMTKEQHQEVYQQYLDFYEGRD